MQDQPGPLGLELNAVIWWNCVRPNAVVMRLRAFAASRNWAVWRIVGDSSSRRQFL
jgi:hypothetical protein